MSSCNPSISWAGNCVTYKSRGYDVLIEPNVGDVGTTDFTQKKRLMDAGIQAAKQAMPRIRQLMEEKS